VLLRTNPRSVLLPVLQCWGMRGACCPARASCCRQAAPSTFARAFAQVVQHEVRAFSARYAYGVPAAGERVFSTRSAPQQQRRARMRQ